MLTTEAKERIRDIRGERLYEIDPPLLIGRTDAQYDVDRVVYSPYFRRLSGVTQVVSVAEGDMYHNRLMHSMKVAQIGRRLAQELREKYKREMSIQSEDFLTAQLEEIFGGLDPEVVAAAGFAHDMGHPPFGHAGEQALNSLMESEGGFEGNAQTFRIVTRLARRAHSYNGLNLTRATLNAILKYPWLRGGSPDKRKKWGAYLEDVEAFNWVRYSSANPERQSLEAAIMDWSDDVTYAVHDLEDFYVAGILPLNVLAAPGGLEEWKRILEIAERSKYIEKKPENESLPRDLHNLLQLVFSGLEGRYEESRGNAIKLRQGTSLLLWEILGKKVGLGDADSRPLVPDQEAEKVVNALKTLIWVYVISRPGMRASQIGQRNLIKELFGALLEEARGKHPGLIFGRETLRDLENTQNLEGTSAERTICDVITRLTESEAIKLHRILNGRQIEGMTNNLYL